MEWSGVLGGHLPALAGSGRQQELGRPWCGPHVQTCVWPACTNLREQYGGLCRALRVRARRWRGAVRRALFGGGSSGGGGRSPAIFAALLRSREPRAQRVQPQRCVEGGQPRQQQRGAGQEGWTQRRGGAHHRQRQLGGGGGQRHAPRVSCCPAASSAAGGLCVWARSPPPTPHRRCCRRPSAMTSRVENRCVWGGGGSLTVKAAMERGTTKDSASTRTTLPARRSRLSALMLNARLAAT